MKLFKKPDILVCEITELKTLAEKSKGLIGFTTPHAVHFKARLGIHTFGMGFPIDVIIADGNFRIRKIRRSLPPGKFFFWNPAWQNVFELPVGFLDASRFQTGDILELLP